MLTPTCEVALAEEAGTSAVGVVPAAATIVLCALLLFPGSVLCQSSSDLSLFESVGPTRSVDGSSSDRRNSPRRSTASTSEAEFSLIGTSRIGATASVTLRHRSGIALRVPMRRQRIQVPGYEQYVIVGFDSNSVSIQYPQSVSCANFAADGFVCDEIRNVAMLSLTVSDVNLRRAEQNKTQPQGSGPEQQEANSVSTNPFEALRKRPQNAAGPAGQPNRFQPRRIDPSDVPPGMRVVSTPFGDRLVEE